MRLRKIRLAGFKSFVDPTTIALPSDLIGIVGPNGCGKSNVIDAVRWVMGEISAKHLRGDTMADVVFTGSSIRKPVGQASVELVFDNADGRAGGRFASYTEIAVKRQVGRDGQSSYFLNGTRCRRRDVMDIFLGTGLGPRSYAIIEQGMISRLIEAKPEELRDFLEEAAGISKYKERRRETENRIRHTNDNLSRLTDIRDELGKRLQHLKRQATMAEKYQVLKVEQRQLEGEMLALRWRALSGEAQSHTELIAAQETKLEAAIASQRNTEAAVEEHRVEQASATEHFNAVYRQTLDAGAAIARIEEAMENQRNRQAELSAALEQEREALVASRSHAETEARKMAELKDELGEAEPTLERLQAAASESRFSFRESEEAMHAWQSEWEALSARAAEPDQIKHAESARVEHVQENVRQMQSRTERLTSERDALDIDSLEQSVRELGATLELSETEIREREELLREQQGKLSESRAKYQACADALHEARQQNQEQGGRLSSLRELQQQALGKAAGSLSNWLAEVGLDRQPRLAERVNAAPGWEFALETVLGARLEAVCTEGMDRYVDAVASLAEGELTLYDGSHAAPVTAPAPDTLAAKVQAPWSLESLLHGVYVADSLQSALARRASLAPSESVVTADGVWLARDWVRVSRAGDAHAGVLAREQEIQSLADDVEQGERALEEHVRQVEQARAELADVEQSLDAAQRDIAERHRESSAAKSTLAGAEAKLEQARSRIANINTELADTQAQLGAEQGVLEQARQRLAQSAQDAERIYGEREAWELKRTLHRQAFEQARERWQGARDEAYDIGLRVESARAQLASIEEGRARNLEQLERLEMRCTSLETDIESSAEPLLKAKAELEQKLAERGAVDESLRVARSKMEGVESTLSELEQRRAKEEQQVAAERDRLNESRMQAQEAVVRQRTIEEQASAAEADIPALLETIDEQASEAAWQEKLDAMERRISRLGAINLAAIDEHEQQSERKTYLDAQNADLEEALATLQSAIGTIDRETRARFRETYEKVNASLIEMFPRLFGGGSAHLELTDDDDLLNTGVSVMARPPGKRNTRIQLLSGGEKALTAVALVFAIFELNPAPFCLLDEVDAPLDDANVGRFCGLVKEMSERVQLVMITHNKLTMETAEQLIGVTMNEPGVSRLVSVDMEEAVALAGE